MKIILISLCLFLILGAEVYGGYGFISAVTGQMEGTGLWIDESGFADWTPASLSWNVTRNSDSTWRYEYSFNVYRASVSHFILEVSETFTINNIFNVQYPGHGIQIGTFEPGHSNPYMPGYLRGIKFDNIVGTTVNIRFDSDRGPMWGDFYAKNGKVGGVQNTLWNKGFSDSDPGSPAADGTINNHILVPDTVVPEPVSIILLGLGAILVRTN